MEFNDRLKKLRLNNDLTQKEASELIGLKRSAYSLYELGKREPTLETLKRIAIDFKVSVDYLLGIEGNETIKDKKIIRLQEENKILKDMLQKYSALITQFTELKEK